MIINNKPLSSFLQAGCPSCRQTNSVKSSSDCTRTEICPHIHRSLQRSPRPHKKFFHHCWYAGQSTLSECVITGSSWQETQLMLTNPRDAFRGQWRSPNIVPFHMLDIVSTAIVCNSNFVCKMCRFFRYSISKKCCDLEIRERGQSRSLKLVPFDRLGSFLLVFHRKFVSKCTVIEIFDFRNALTWKLGQGLSRSLEMSPFSRAHPTSYWHSIVTMALSRVVSEIFNVEKMLWPWNLGERSLKVIEDGTIR